MQSILSRFTVSKSSTRLRPSLVALAFAVAMQLPAGAVGPNPDFPSVSTSIPNKNFIATYGTPAIDLRNHFAVTGITGTVAQFDTSLGKFNVELSAAAPATVANFLTYVNANRYSNSILHRRDSAYNILQGGSFLNDANLSSIATNAAIAMEAANTVTHTRGTIAMARTSAGLNTATSGWFFNYADNSGLWAPASALNSQSYAAFGRVTGTGMTVVDALAACPLSSGNLTVTSSSTSSASVTVLHSSIPTGFGVGWGLLGQTVTGFNSLTPTLDAVTLSGFADQTISTDTPVQWSRLGAPFAQLPFLAALPVDNTIFLANLVTVNSIKVVPLFPATANAPAVATFTASSSNPQIVPTVTGSSLALGATGNVSATATITVIATDTNGNTGQTTFTATVTPGPSLINASYGTLVDTGLSSQGYWYNAELGYLTFQNNLWSYCYDLRSYLYGDGSARLYSPVYGYLYYSGDGDHWYYSTSIGWMYVGSYGGYVWSSRFGWVWPNGDGVYFYSTSYGWLYANGAGSVWSYTYSQWL